MAKFSEEQVAALREAIASGVTSVSYDGRTVTYRSLADMERTLARLEADLDPASQAPRYSRIAFKRP